jgi:nicotinamide-nucleotide amidase
MVAGALSRSPADLALGVTGVLGPEPDEDGNPVGLAFLACGRRGMLPQIVRKDYGAQPHDLLRRAVVLDAFALVAAHLENPWPRRTGGPSPLQQSLCITGTGRS